MVESKDRKRGQVKGLWVVWLWLCCLVLAACSARQPEAANGQWATVQAKPGAVDTAAQANGPLDSAVAQELDPARDGWQRPALLLDKVGVQPGQVVVELGAGTGYFVRHLLARGAVVVAAEPDSARVRYLRGNLHTLGADSSRVQIRHISYREPMLQPQEAHYILLVNTYTYLPYRSYYARKLHRGLRQGGRLVVVDWLAVAPVVATATNQRLAPAVVVGELREAGFRSFEIDSTSLPYQYLIIAE